MKDVHSTFHGEIISSDGVTVCTRTRITGRRSKRGDGQGLVWRGVFHTEGCQRMPMIGEPLHIRLSDDSRIAIVVIDLAGEAVHFRARGKMPAADS